MQRILPAFSSGTDSASAEHRDNAGRCSTRPLVLELVEQGERRGTVRSLRSRRPCLTAEETSAAQQPGTWSLVVSRWALSHSLLADDLTSR